MITLSKMETNFYHNGLMVLQPIKAIVTEKVNGDYSLKITMPCGFLEIENEQIIKAPKPKSDQLFRVYNSDVMGNAIISRRGRGDYATIKFENYGSLEHTTLSGLSEGRSSLAGASTDSYAFFAGGVCSSTVDVYDINLTRSTAASLKEAKNALAGTNLEDYAIFAGGYCVSTASRPTTVDLYANGKFEFTVFKDSKYKFQNMSSEVTVNSNMVTVSISQPATGYIKVKNTTI